MPDAYYLQLTEQLRHLITQHAAQWAYIYMERTDQWRCTPPTHAVVAFQAALAQHRAEGRCGRPLRPLHLKPRCASGGYACVGM